MLQITKYSRTFLMFIDGVILKIIYDEHLAKIKAFMYLIHVLCYFSLYGILAM